MQPTVVVGYERSPHSERVLMEAGREAVRRGAAVKVVHALLWFPARGPFPSPYAPLETAESIADAARQTAAHGAETLRRATPT